jgi:hypothetical protein
LELLSVLVLDMIQILPPLGKYKYDTWRILPVKCYINNFVRLWSYIRNVNRASLIDLNTDTTSVSKAKCFLVSR